MVIEAVIIPAATGVVGIALGLGAALVLKHKGREIPKAEDKSVWDSLKELTAERAEYSAKKKALHRAYAAGSMDEAVFVTKDAHYTKMIDQLDSDIDAAVIELSRQFLPEEMAKGKAKLQELSDLAVLSKKLEELKQDKRALEEESSKLYLQLTELEEDKKMELAEKNQLREKYRKDSKRLKEMMGSIAELERHRKELEKAVEGIKPRDERIAMLQRENRVLRKGLSNARKRISTGEKEVGVLSAIIERHANEIDEAKKAEELKELVQPANPGVRELVGKYRTPQQAYEFVRDHIAEVHPKVSASYWLSVDDIIRIGAADFDDKSILLCSMLRAMGEDAWVALLEMKNGYKRAVVLTDDHVLDVEDIRKYDDFAGLSWEEALKSYRFDGFPVKRMLFRFNESSYIEPKH